MATKFLVAELGPVEILALRLALGVPCLGLIVLAKRVPLGLTRELAGPLLLAGVILTVHFLVQTLGLVTATATNTGWFISTSPLALALLSFLFLGERIGWREVAGIGVATSGILLLVSRGRFTDLGWVRSTGDWLVLASALTWAVYTVATRDLVRARDPLAVAFVVLLVTAVLTAIPFAVVADLEAIRGLSPRATLAVLWLAVAGLALGHWFWQEGVGRLGATRAGLYLYLEPLATVSLAVPLLDEPLGPFVLLGGGLVLAGVYLGQRSPAKESASPTLPTPRRR